MYKRSLATQRFDISIMLCEFRSSCLTFLLLMMNKFNACMVILLNLISMISAQDREDSIK
jgi:hypothetical protein